MNEMTSQGLVQCQFCGRKFNETAAARHVVFCEKKSKENKIKGGLNAAKGQPAAQGMRTTMSGANKLRR